MRHWTERAERGTTCVRGPRTAGRTVRWRRFLERPIVWSQRALLSPSAAVAAVVCAGIGSAFGDLADALVGIVAGAAIGAETRALCRVVATGVLRRRFRPCEFALLAHLADGRDLRFLPVSRPATAFAVVSEPYRGRPPRLVFTVPRGTTAVVDVGDGERIAARREGRASTILLHGPAVQPPALAIVGVAEDARWGLRAMVAGLDLAGSDVRIVGRLDSVAPIAREAGLRPVAWPRPARWGREMENALYVDDPLVARPVALAIGIVLFFAAFLSYGAFSPGWGSLVAATSAWPAFFGVSALLRDRLLRRRARREA